MLLILGGCRAEPAVEIDLRVLDSIPVVPLQFSDGADETASLRHSATGLLLGDGIVLTCAHTLPSERQHGRVRVTGPWISYEVRTRGSYRGDGSEPWKDTEPPESLDDWAVITLDPPVEPAHVILSSQVCPLTFEPPSVGETVYLVGYTVEPVEGSPDGAFVRYWVPLLVVPAPTNVRSAFESSVVWLRGPSRPFAQTQVHAYGGKPLASLRQGFSGAPVLRVRDDGAGGVRLEVCAILHGRALRRDDLGVAIVPARFEVR
ncbi:MAG: trypsin-like peptidase domain-containing protein [Phycisphaerales bacterium]|nr:trypsin-like peptidase domain-containing protein [Phycisphaerales bacterium]